MAGNSNSGGSRKNAGRKSNASKLLDAGFVAPWFTQEFQEIKWKKFLASDDEKVQLDSMKYITDRLHGKAAQAVDMNLAGEVGIKSILVPERIATERSATDITPDFGE